MIQFLKTKLVKVVLFFSGIAKRNVARKSDKKKSACFPKTIISRGGKHCFMESMPVGAPIRPAELLPVEGVSFHAFFLQCLF